MGADPVSSEWPKSTSSESCKYQVATKLYMASNNQERFNSMDEVRLMSTQTAGRHT